MSLATDTLSKSGIIDRKIATTRRKSKVWRLSSQLVNRTKVW